MPKTKLGESVKRNKATVAKRIKTRSINTIAKTPKPTYKDYRLLCDILFETWIRERDRWRCVLTDIEYKRGDYEHYHACHFISRRILATRYSPYNCHGQSGWLNYQQRLGNVQVIDQYRRFMYKTYGASVVKHLYALSRQHTRWKLEDWINKTAELYTQMLSLPDGEEIIDQRLSKIFNSIGRRHTLEQMLNSLQLNHLTN